MDRMRLPLLCALLLSFPGALAAQDTPAAGREEADRAWEDLVAATRQGAATAGQGTAGAPDPIRSFHLRAEVLTRDGVQTNETKIDYRFLAPDCIRFALPSRREVGRFGPRQRDYWLLGEKEGDVVTLSGKDYEKDRRQIDEMLAVARNFVALSDPARLKVTRKELLEGAPADLPEALREDAARLRWLGVASPDFALLSPAAALRGEGEEEPSTYRVELGLGEDSLPHLVVIREDRVPGRRPADPMLLRLARFAPQNEFQIPKEIRVHTVDRRSRKASFTEKPTQEVYVTSTDLRPELTVEDFRPAGR